MSTEVALRFLELISQDRELEHELRAVLAGQDDDAKLVTFAADHGHSFTAAELHEVLDLCRHNQNELSQTDLESVSGGLGPQPEPPDMPLRGRLPRLSPPSWLLGGGK